jgi:hypothetical protein
MAITLDILAVQISPKHRGGLKRKSLILLPQQPHDMALKLLKNYLVSQRFCVLGIVCRSPGKSHVVALPCHRLAPGPAGGIVQSGCVGKINIP